MSKLYYTERGHSIPWFAEEITRFRRVKKVLNLEPTERPAILYVLARTYADSAFPLHISVNGTEIAPVDPYLRDRFRWYQITLAPELLRRGDNSFELWCDSTAMNAWSLGLEAGHAGPNSYVSDDEGLNWRNHHMGYLNVERGEYVIRIRLSEGEDAPVPPFVWEDPSAPKVESLRSVIPHEAREERTSLGLVRALTTWLSSSWEHTSRPVATVCTPWDAETVLDWGKAQRGHNAQRPIVNCIYYGTSFVSAAQAVGIPARCAVFTDQQPDGWFGHFTAEFWSDEHQKWVMVDPNIDAIFWKDGEPMSVSEIQCVLPDLERYAMFGPGTASQRENPRMVQWLANGYMEGRCFQHRAVWYRTDLLTRPELSPPAHGSQAYCETGLVWEMREKEIFGMFPYFGNSDYFDAPPQGFTTKRTKIGKGKA